MQVKKEKLSQELRIALWYVYGHKCAYTQEHIPGPEHVVIDHVIPERLAGNADELNRLREAFGLAGDFRVQKNIGNYVPTTKPFNELKADKTGKEEIVPQFSRAYRHHRSYDDYARAADRSAHELIGHGLALAKQNRDAVTRMLKLVQGTAKALKAKEEAHGEMAQLVWDRMLRAGGSSLPETGSRVLGAAISGQSSTSAGEFPDSNFEDSEEWVRYSRPAVVLHAHLPQVPDATGSALVHFSAPALQNALITFNHQEIVDQLLPGFGFAPAPDARPFLVDQSGDEWTVQLANVRCQLDEQSTNSLCDVVDRLARRYLLASEDLERHVFRSVRFPYARRGYRLWCVPRKIWYEIMAFAREHDYGAGRAQWHVFDAKANSFLVVGSQRNDSEFRVPVAMFHAEVVMDVLDLPGGAVYVCWNADLLHRMWARFDRPAGSEIWDAEQAHEWFAELLDEVTYGSRMDGPKGSYSPVRQSWFGKRLLGGKGPPREAPPAPARTLPGSSMRAADLLPQTAWAAFRSYRALQGSACAIQRHFGPPYTTARRDSLLGVYEFLRWFTRNAARFGFADARVGGISHALGRPFGSPVEPLLDSLVAEAEQSVIANPGRMDLALRAVIEVLRDPIAGEAEDALVEAATEHMACLYEDYRLPAYLERLRSRHS